MFEKYHTAEAVRKVLVPAAQYRPFPKCGEENTLTDAQKADMIVSGEKYLDYGWPVATAMQYTMYVTHGTREPYEMSNYARRREALAHLVNAEYAENKGRFIPDIINGLWAIMDEATWVVPAHNYKRPEATLPLPDFKKPIIIDLFSAGTAGLLANAYYLFKEQIDAVSPLILERLEMVMDERILTPFMKNLYWWSGMQEWWTNNWNPWILSNILTCFGLVEKDDDRRAAAVGRSAWMLEKFLDEYHPDGGCDEGPSYWGVAGASLFDCLCELNALTGGAYQPYFEDSLIRDIGLYICRAHIAGPYFTNYADAPKLFRASPVLIYRYGKAIGDRGMMQMGAALFKLYAEEDGGAKVGINVHANYRQIMDTLAWQELEAEEAKFPLLEEEYIEGIQFVAGRTKGGEENGLYFSAKGGYNDESHNHNDIGTFILFSDGKPAIVDIGSGLYNAKTFSAQRYEIPQMQSSYHNLPEINGKMQMFGPQYKSRSVSYKTENGVTAFSLDIADPYVDAGVETWQRTFLFDRTANTLTVRDEAAFTGKKNHADTMFIVPTQPVVDGNAVTVPVEGGRDVVIVGEGVTFTAERFDVSYDKNLNTQWNGAVWRVKAAADCGTALQQTFTITQK